MPDRYYAAFISYSHRYGPWVEALQRNLEACLQHYGATPHQVFLDKVDLGSGRSWVAQLQEGLGRAAHLVLVMTPEALAAPRVEDEWQAFVATRPDWLRGSFHLVRLVDAPLPPFLAQVQWVDFEDHDPEKYRQGLRELTGGLLAKRGKRDLPELPPTLEPVDPPSGLLPSELRNRLVAFLAARIKEKPTRLALAAILRMDWGFMETHTSWECAASAVLVRANGADAPVAAARRVVDGLRELFDEDEEATRELQGLERGLISLQQATPETGLLATYLRQVASDHDRLVPYFQQHAELDLLDRVYVRLELRPEAPVLAAERKGGEGLPGAVGVRELLALDPGERPWITRRWVVLGDPGAGKTTLVRHLAASLAKDPDRGWVPVLESLPRMMRERDWLLDRIARRLKRAGHPADALPAVLDREGREGRLLVLLDGLDEVPKEEREEAETLLRDLSERWGETPIVVTSRPIGYRSPGSDFRELELLPLGRERRLEFLARWFGRSAATRDEARAAEALGVLHEDPGLWALAGNPLYLTLMALLLEQGDSPRRHRAKLYDQVFELLLEGTHRRGGTDGKAEPMPAQKAVRGVLDYLGFELTRDNRDAEGVLELEARLLREEADSRCKPLRREPRWQHSLRVFLDDLAERTGILGDHDGPDADWRFWHRTFREALAAEELEARWKRGGTEAILEHARQVGEGEDESRWAEPYALLAGRVSEPDSLVKALVAENRQLGLRALATAQGLAEATLAEILELSSDDWKDRRKVYERLPDLLADGERALLLVDRLRRGTRDGNDLYFLCEAVREAERRWPGLARMAEQLRVRFFDHLPPPPPELFEEVNTPHDGPVPLWREIPAGSFRMGSPEGEEGAREDEHPQHDVELSQPFRMMAVPVTNAQFAEFDPGHEWYPWEGVSEDDLAHHPVVNVTWYQAVSFCRWLATLHPGARLPTEAEWEYACRAGTGTPYWSGPEEADLRKVAWYDRNSEGRTHRVGGKPANPWGLYDAHGNVWEWCEDVWDLAAYGKRSSYATDPVTTEGEAAVRVVRGGAWDYTGRHLRAAYRDRGQTTIRVRYLGFRCVCRAGLEP